MEKQFKTCGARAKQNNHQPCRKPGMQNGRCRLHGGLSTGPKTDEGRGRISAANFKHGFYTSYANTERKLTRKSMREWYDEIHGF